MLIATSKPESRPPVVWFDIYILVGEAIAERFFTQLIYTLSN